MLRIIKILIILLIMLPAVASAQLPRLASVPDELPPGIRESLQLDKASLEWKRSDLRARVNNFNSECASVKAGSAEDTECREVYGRLNGEMQSLATEISAFNMAVKQAFAEAKSKVKTAPPSSLTFMGPKAAPAKSGDPLSFEPPRLVACGKSRECIERIRDKPLKTEREIEMLMEFDRENPLVVDPGKLEAVPQAQKVKLAKLGTTYKEKSLQQEKLGEKIDQLEKTKKQANTRYLQAAKNGAADDVEAAKKLFKEADDQQMLLILAVEKLELEKREIDLEWTSTQQAIKELTLEIARRYESPAPPPIDYEFEWSPADVERIHRYTEKFRIMIKERNKNLPWGPGKKYRSAWEWLKRPGNSLGKSVGSTGTTATEVTLGGKG